MFRSLWLLLMVLLGAAPALGQPPEAQPPREEEIEVWVGQLEAPQYRVREMATYRLVQAGEDAVPALEQAVVASELETSLRALQVLRRLAEPVRPDEPAAAWDSLQRIAGEGLSSAASRARTAVGEIRGDRLRKAVGALAEAGVPLEYGDFAIGMRTLNVVHVRIPAEWSGPPEALLWMRWLYDVKFAALEGPAIDEMAMRHVAEMPDLENLAIRDAPNLTAADIAPLEAAHRLQFLDLQYVPLENDALGVLSKLRIVGVLRLFGTQIDRPTAEQLDETLRQATVEHAGGAFLGVATSSGSNDCELGRVTPGSAAEQAGLQPGDVITQVNGTPVQDFSELQQAIGQFTPGSEVEIEYRRGDQQRSTTAELGKFEPRQFR